ncbi:MAG TPA: response regulator [Armatimonadota bacterium]|jgi:two-component system chemotaxis response regulator CheY
MALNVLIVDDSRVMRSMIIRTLRLSGVPVAEVYEAGDGKEGLELLNENWIDLALIDINMPVMTGEEMIHQVRANPITSDLRVIVVSTESSETRVNRLKEQGAAFLHKPFTPEELRQVVVDVTGVSLEQPDDELSLSGSNLSF